MLNLKTKIAAASASAIILGSIMTSGAFAANNVTVSGNGAGSSNTVKVKNKQKTKVTQSNATAVVNLVGVFQNTGGNKANNNTGGDVTSNSGDATATVTNTTTTGGNVARVDPCGCPPGDNTVTVSGNGAGSDNTVKIKSKSVTKVEQTNETLVLNGTLVIQNTGGNTANGNTGGDVESNSGDAEATVENTVETGGNRMVPPSL